MKFFKESYSKVCFDSVYLSNFPPSGKLITDEGKACKYYTFDDLHKNDIQSITYQYHISPKSEVAVQISVTATNPAMESSAPRLLLICVDILEMI